KSDTKPICQSLPRVIEVLLTALEQPREPGRGAPVVSLDGAAAKPPIESESDNSAIEQALVSKGLVLLPAGTYRISPSISWAHSGNGNNETDSYFYGLGLDVGLPWGMSASLNVPYVQRDYSWGRNDGVGDFSVSLSKTLAEETAKTPSLVMRLGYVHDNGKDPFNAVPIGGGFRSVEASLSAFKRIEPLVLYGHLSYSHGWSTTATYLDGATYYTSEITPADGYGLGLGASLAATPEISLDAGLSFDFKGKNKVAPLEGNAYNTARTVAGYFHFGSTFVLDKNLSLNLTAAAGVTDDAEDFIFMASLPYRF
ncbi:hypothetical protein, partial [Propionivibrio sp.]|uniref:hypothetical protein n=1 Tax=Propionivibrio sp. TaxID=2212460 RepID=UPI003BF1208C